MRSLYDRVPEVCSGQKWVKEKQERWKSARQSWKDKFMGGHHLQCAVDVGRVRTSIWYGRCVGWASEDRFGKRLRDVCKPGDSQPANLLRRLEHGHWLGRRMEDGKQRVFVCKGGG